MARSVGGRGVQSVEVGARLLTALVQIGQPAMLRDLEHAVDDLRTRRHGLVDRDVAGDRRVEADTAARQRRERGGLAGEHLAEAA